MNKNNKFNNYFIAFCVLYLISRFVNAVENDTNSDTHTIKDAETNIEAEYDKNKLRKFAVGVGAAVVRFNSKFKSTNKETGQSVFIDAEGTLGLPEVAHVNTLYGAFLIAEKHSVGFSYFGIKRESSLFALDLNFADVILVQGDAKLKDETDFYQLAYGYRLFKDDRSNIKAMLGLYGLDLKLAFEAEGEFTVNGVTQTGTYREEVSVFAPLPVLGLDFFFSFTPRWHMNTKIAFVGGSYQDISANILTTSINARYDFTKYIGGVVGIAYFDAKVDIEEETTLQEVAYGYSGIYGGLHFVF